MKKKSETFVHQSRNGFYVIWDGETLTQARGLTYRDLEKNILESEIPEKVRIELLKNLQQLTQDFKGSPVAEIVFPKRVLGEDEKYRLGTKAIHPRTGRLQIRVRGGWKDLNDSLS